MKRILIATICGLFINCIAAPRTLSGAVLILEDNAFLLGRNQHPFFAETEFFPGTYLSGLIQVDVVSSNRNPTMGRFVPSNSVGDVWLSRGTFYLDALPFDNTSIHVTYTSRSPVEAKYRANDELTYVGSAHNLDEANIVFADFNQYPFYFRGGRSYIRFGDYTRNEIPMSLPQYFTTIRSEALEVGFADWCSFNGSVALFRGPKRLSSGRAFNNSVVQLGYLVESGNYGLNVSVDWLYDIAAVNYITNGTTVTAPGVLRRVSAWSISAAAYVNQFGLKLEHALSSRAFNPANLTFNAEAAKPDVWSFAMNYHFPITKYKGQVSASYQITHEAIGLALPERRWQGEFKAYVSKYTEFALSLIYDEDYGTNDSGTAGGVATTIGTHRTSTTTLFNITMRLA